MGVRITGVDVGVGVGEDATDGPAGDGASCGAVCSLSLFFLPVVRFCVFRRGAGELRGCAIELPSLLKKSPIGLAATAECPPARNAIIDAIKTTLLSRQTISAPTLHLRNEVFNISDVFPGTRAKPEELAAASPDAQSICLAPKALTVLYK